MIALDAFRKSPLIDESRASVEITPALAAAPSENSDGSENLQVDAAGRSERRSPTARYSSTPWPPLKGQPTYQNCRPWRPVTPSRPWLARTRRPTDLDQSMARVLPTSLRGLKLCAADPSALETMSISYFRRASVIGLAWLSHFPFGPIRCEVLCRTPQWRSSLTSGAASSLKSGS